MSNICHVHGIAEPWMHNWPFSSLKTGHRSLAKGGGQGQCWVLYLHDKARLKVRYFALRYWLFPMEAFGKEYQMHPI
jgi:hypothetical protein